MGADRWTGRQVSIDADLAELYEVEAQVTATSPHVLDTGGPGPSASFWPATGHRSPSCGRSGSGRARRLPVAAREGGADELEIRSIAVIPACRARGSGAR